MGLIKDRHGTYYARKKVPVHLQAAVARVLGGKRRSQVFLKKSLGTKHTTHNVESQGFCFACAPRGETILSSGPSTAVDHLLKKGGRSGEALTYLFSSCIGEKE